MVLWELTLATAYVLGLKRTYKLALRIQRRLITPRYPRLRDFAQRRTRNIFDIALSVHRKVQERDIEVGRSTGNWILRWLDRMKPSANIRGDPPCKITANETRSTSKTLGATPSTDGRQLNADRETGRTLIVRYMPGSGPGNDYIASSSKNRNSEGFRLESGFGIRSLPKMTHGLFGQPVRRNLRALGSCTHVSFNASLTSQLHSKRISRGVIREDIALWMQALKK